MSVPMAAHFANSYVDRLFEERDFFALHHLISVLGVERKLPDEFWLFCSIYEWAPARSGVWQYYEGLPDEKFDRISQALDRFGLDEIAEKYRHGKRTWNGPMLASDLDAWLEANQHQIHDAVFNLIASQKDCLRIVS